MIIEQNEIRAVTPVLKILDANVEYSHGCLIIQGHVVNTCQVNTEAITVFAGYFSKNGVLLNEENMLMEDPVLLVGDSSFFSISTPFNPDYEYAIISFKYLTGTSIKTSGDKKVIRPEE